MSLNSHLTKISEVPVNVSLTYLNFLLGMEKFLRMALQSIIKCSHLSSNNLFTV